MFGQKSKRGTGHASGVPGFKTFKSPKPETKDSAKSPQQCAMDGLARAAGMGKGKR